MKGIQIMRKVTTPDSGVKLWLSANDTYNWANRADATWPCSFLADKPLFAEFDSQSNLIDLAINYGRGKQDCPSDEFTAITDDFLRKGV